MTERERILRLLFRAILDIRVASYTGDYYTCFILADVFHNVPLKMLAVDNGQGSDTEILAGIEEKCEERKCLSWLQNANADLEAWSQGQGRL